MLQSAFAQAGPRKLRSPKELSEDGIHYNLRPVASVLAFLEFVP